MIVDGTRGEHIQAYTGSTTGTSRSNEICSRYAPITWHVDRKCHEISAKSFDKMCEQMKAQLDDMTSDLHPHGAREVVVNSMTANNGRDRRLQRQAVSEHLVARASGRHLALSARDRGTLESLSHSFRFFDNLALHLRSERTSGVGNEPSKGASKDCALTGPASNHARIIEDLQ